MKKIFCLLITIFFGFLVINISLKAKATFDEISKEKISLGYGITLEHITGKSTTAYNEGTKEQRFQSVFTAYFNPSSDVRIVDWSSLRESDNSWLNTSLEKLAKEYEKLHPEDKVIVATNNWLSIPDAGNNGEISGIQITNGLNFKVSGRFGGRTFNENNKLNVLGFSKDGKKVIYSSSYGKDDYNHFMSLYYVDKDNNYEKTDLNIDIYKVNEAPSDGEISIYFSDYKGEMTVPGAKLYRFDGEILRHDKVMENERDEFALGTFYKNTNFLDFSIEKEEIYEGEKLIDEKIHSATFYIASKNAEFDKLDFNKTFLAQYDLIGEYAEIYNATAFYHHLNRNGVKYEFDNPSSPWASRSEGVCTPNPRTAFVIMKDGSYGISVIDGRGNGRDTAYGMDFEDMGNFYDKYYDAKEVFNYDGGGSSCMIVANQQGGFDIVNRPSDGSERPVANCLLFVAKRYDVNVIQTDSSTSSVTLKVNNNDSSISKITAKINNTTKEVIDGTVSFDNLEPSSFYNVELFYEIEDKEIIGTAIKVNTDSLKPSVEDFVVLETSLGYANLSFKINDDYHNFIDGYYYINDVKTSFINLENEISAINLSPGKTYNVDIYINFKNTVGNSVSHETFTFKTLDPPYPLSISLGEASIDLNINDSYKLEITKTPLNTKTTYTYSSSDESVATVNDKGRISAISEGIATITVTTLEGVSASIDVIVTDPNKAPAKTGCNSGALIISLISLTSLLFILRKKK